MSRGSFLESVHQYFDRMMSRHEELVKPELLEQMEPLTGMKIEAEEKKNLIRGPEEERLVNAALEQTMIRSYQKIHDCWKERSLPDLRTASFLFAIERVAESYKHHGIFP